MSELDTQEFFEERDQQDLDDRLQSMEEQQFDDMVNTYWEEGL